MKNYDQGPAKRVFIDAAVKCSPETIVWLNTLFRYRSDRCSMTVKLCLAQRTVNPRAEEFLTQLKLQELLK